MISAEELSGLLGDLYAAPLEAEKWQEFFDRLCGITECHIGVFVASRSGAHRVVACGGIDLNPEPLRLYNEYYAPQDPYSGPCFARQQHGVFEDEALVARDGLLRTEFYNDLLSRFDMEHLTVVPCRVAAEYADVISLWRGRRQGPLDVDSADLLKLLLPHLQTALRLRGMVMEQERVSVFCEAALDAMSVAAFLVSGKGRVRHMNGRAKALLEAGSGLAMCGGRLVAGDSNETAQLDRLLRGATVYGGGSSELSPGGAMRVLQARRPLQITVMPAPEVNGLAGPERCALVFVSDPGTKSRSRAEFMRQLYGLTPTECRIADAMLQGLEVREAAEHLHITLETARFHLKRIFSKTGVGRQAELIRLMMSLPGCERNGDAVRRMTEVSADSLRE